MGRGNAWSILEKQGDNLEGKTTCSNELLFFHMNAL